MANASKADQAIATLNGTDLGGRTLTINEAKPKAERPRGGGGGGRRFGGGGGRDDYRGYPRGKRAGSFFRMHKVFRPGDQMPVGDE